MTDKAYEADKANGVRDVSTSGRRAHAEQRMTAAKAGFTRAAEAALRGDPLAGDLAWYALAELEAARAALRALEHQ